MKFKSFEMGKFKEITLKMPSMQLYAIFGGRFCSGVRTPWSFGDPRDSRCALKSCAYRSHEEVSKECVRATFECTLEDGESGEVHTTTMMVDMPSEELDRRLAARDWTAGKCDHAGGASRDT